MISVIVPSRNAARTLGVLIDSIRVSPCKNVEMIVVDDASSDDTAAVAEGRGAKVIRLPSQSGPAAARNRGAAEARGGILLFLDSDVRLQADTLGYIAGRFEKDPGLNCLVGIYSKTPLNKGLFPRYKALFCYYWFKDAKEMESFETSCGAIRKCVFEKVGGFNASYRGADVEDYEFGYRLGGNYKVVLDTRVQVDHHYPGFVKNAKNFFHRGRMWFTLFRKRRKFDSAGGTTPGQAAGMAAAAPLAAALLCAPFFGAPGAAAVALCGAAYLLVNGPFFLYCAREAGPRVSLAAIGLHFANSLVVLAAVAAAVVTPARRQAKGPSE